MARRRQAPPAYNQNSSAAETAPRPTSLLPHASFATPQLREPRENPNPFIHGRSRQREASTLTPELLLAQHVAQTLSAMRTTQQVSDEDPALPYDLPQRESEQVTLDTQERPPPMKEEEMMVDLACVICMEHLVDTVVMPCMHAVMCNWCAEIYIPSKRGTPYTPRDATAKCPFCRATVEEKRTIFLPGASTSQREQHTLRGNRREREVQELQGRSVREERLGRYF